MNLEGVEEVLVALATHPGIAGCALAEAGSGMVLFHAGGLPAMERTAEAAMEFWRVHQRNAAHFEAFGALQSVACGFGSHVAALFPCNADGLVLVCVAEKQNVAWAEWGRQVDALKRHLA
jgi:hypothetical protein